MIGARFDVDISDGIRCQIEITNYTPEVKGVYDRAPENCYPDEPAEFEHIFLTRFGRQSDVLERIATEADHERIYEMLLKEIENE